MPHSFIASLLKLVLVTVFSYTVAFILLASSSQSVVPVSDSWRHFPNPAAPLPSLVLAVPQLEADEVASAHARVAMAVAHGGTVVCLSKKVEFLRLQNGSDIRGVAVARIEGEPVNLTEDVTKAIAAAFAAWLLNKKLDDLRRLRISVGHDSRISAHKLQNPVTYGITAAGHDILQFGLASTPAMFNSTLTEDESSHIPVVGAIMMTDYSVKGRFQEWWIEEKLKLISSMFIRCSIEGFNQRLSSFLQILSRVDYAAPYSSLSIHVASTTCPSIPIFLCAPLVLSSEAPLSCSTLEVSNLSTSLTSSKTPESLDKATNPVWCLPGARQKGLNKNH
jgi:hypothetical protein